MNKSCATTISYSAIRPLILHLRFAFSSAPDRHSQLFPSFLPTFFLIDVIKMILFLGPSSCAHSPQSEDGFILDSDAPDFSVDELNRLFLALSWLWGPTLALKNTTRKKMERSKNCHQHTEVIKEGIAHWRNGLLLNQVRRTRRFLQLSIPSAQSLFSGCVVWNHFPQALVCGWDTIISLVRKSLCPVI